MATIQWTAELAAAAKLRVAVEEDMMFIRSTKFLKGRWAEACSHNPQSCAR